MSSSSISARTQTRNRLNTELWKMPLSSLGIPSVFPRLHWHSARGELAAVQTAIVEGDNVNGVARVRYSNGEEWHDVRALHIAAARGRLKVVIELLKNADIDVHAEAQIVRHNHLKMVTAEDLARAHGRLLCYWKLKKHKQNTKSATKS
mmetsp:Transcript_6190/g.14100  ORF Transcript_6190/g.14100 Transcript_6190/m.14100 type:complete len:149 (+) Transcript_6190:36-482(+)